MKIKIDSNTEEYIVSDFMELEEQKSAISLKQFTDITVDVSYAVAAICLDFANEFLMDEQNSRITIDVILRNAETFINNYLVDKFEAARNALN